MTTYYFIIMFDDTPVVKSIVATTLNCALSIMKGEIRNEGMQEDLIITHIIDAAQGDVWEVQEQGLVLADPDIINKPT